MIRRDSASLPGFTGSWCIFSTSQISDLHDFQNLDGVHGRGGLIQAGNFILRPYRRGGFARHFNKSTYMCYSRFKREYEIHSALWEAGFPTVEPVGYAYKRHFWGVEGVYITKLASALPWPNTWDNNTSSEQIKQIVTLITSLSEWGLWSPDMNATNILIDISGQILALDWDKAKWSRKDLLKQKYWQRLKRSMFKLNASKNLVNSLQQELIGENDEPQT